MLHRRTRDLGNRPLTGRSSGRSPAARLAAITAAVLMVLLASCSGSSDAAPKANSNPANSNGEVGLIPANTSPGRAGSDGSSPPTTTGQGLPTEPPSYAKGLFEAWKAGNKLEAARYGDNATLLNLFAQTYAASDGWKGPNCSAVNGVSTCTWTAKDGRTLDLMLRNDELGNERAVSNAELKAK